VALTQQQQIAIAHAYTPILIYHPDEPYVPVRPEVYMREAALWPGRPTDNKSDWGRPELPGFPRQPLIPRGGISLEPVEDTEGTSDPDGDGVNEWYLGHVDRVNNRPYLTSNEDGELWLDSSGWAESQVVDSVSRNDRCNKAGAAAAWQPAGRFSAHVDWHHTEVHETDDLNRLLLAMTEGGPVGSIIRETLGDIWVVWYYFLYPIHEERLKRCEEVLDVTDRGDYEGDWNAVGVVIKKPLVLPWESPGTPFPAPSHVAFGYRARGIAKEIAPSALKQGMTVRGWSEVSSVNQHPRVFVTLGYHNNYSQSGDHDPPEAKVLGLPLERLTCDITRAIDEGVNDVKESLEDVEETVKDVAVTVAKLIAGAGIGFSFGGPFGAGLGLLAGAVAGLAEALSTSNTDDTPSAEVQKQMEREPGPPAGRFGLVLKPSDVDNPLDKDETAASIRDWAGDDARRLVDRSTQLWWPPSGDQPPQPGFAGRWGVRCTDDPNELRCGIPFPNFQRALLNDLAVHITSTS
jgi:hypothetical protein